jgi:hypothetical protein
VNAFNYGEVTMIQLTKSSRVAFEALGNNEKKDFMGLYRHEDNPEILLDSYKAVKLPNIEKTYMLRLSDQLRAISKNLGREPDYSGSRKAGYAPAHILSF